MSFGSSLAGATVSLTEGADAVELGVLAGAAATNTARSTAQTIALENLVEQIMVLDRAEG